MDADHPQNRFTNRAEYYVRYRPHYPQAIIPFLQEAIGLSPESLLADVGSGTGFLAQRFLQLGCTVCGIEPNRSMREVAEKLLAREEYFYSVAATAEATTLPTHSVDVVAAGQAFHWFDVEAARREFRRILRSSGYVVLVYNHRHVEGSAVADAYRRAVERFGLNEAGPRRRQAPPPERIDALFHPEPFGRQAFDNPQQMDFQGLRGRVLSSSYGPLPGHEKYEPMMAALRELFATYAEDGLLTFPYQTKVYWGRL